MQPDAATLYPDDATLQYATPANRPRPPVLAGAAIVLGGLGLVVLGGCFLVGVLSLVSPGLSFSRRAPNALSGPEWVLMVVLYLLAFACFAGAASMLFLGTRGLLRVLRA